MPTQAVDVPFTSELFYQLSSIEMYGQEKPVLVLSIDEAYMKDLRADDHPIKGSTDNCTIYKAKLLERDAIINGTANPLTVAVKWARGDSGLERLRWEHLLYSNNLSNIQGLFVPKCYGLFASQSEGVTISCLVLDWCQKAPGADSIMMDLTEYKYVTSSHSGHNIIEAKFLVQCQGFSCCSLCAQLWCSSWQHETK